MSNQSKDRFNENILNKLFVLNYAPNGMWTYFTSVYFMTNKLDDGTLEESGFEIFLGKITAFIWAYALTNPGVNALRTPVYAEMINILEKKPIEFADFKFEIVAFENVFNNYSFNNGRPITKSLLAWWACNNENQSLLSLEITFEVEHIYARNRYDNEKSLNNIKNLESLGNKSMLEKRINIRASDYRFNDKKKYYKGYTNSRNQMKEGTSIVELLELISINEDFEELDIELRTRRILSEFISFLKVNDLTK